MKINYLTGMLLLAAIITAEHRNRQSSLNQEITFVRRQNSAIKLALIQMQVVGGELDLNLHHASKRLPGQPVKVHIWPCSLK